MTSKSECFVKRTVGGYKNLFEIISWFYPDFSREFGFKCVFASMVGSAASWFALAPLVPNGIIPWWFWVMVISIFIVPSAVYPFYQAFGICYCGAKS